MLTNKLQWLLQVFAGEGGAGDGGAPAADAGASAAPGANADAAGQRLRELGVPEDKIARQRDRAKRGSAAQAAPRNAAQAQAPTQAAAAPKDSDGAHAEETQAAAPRLSWDEIMKDPEYNKRMQETVQNAKRKSQAAESAMAALAPYLEAKMKEFGMDPQNPDYEVLANKMSGKYAEKAVELGVPEEIAMQLDQQQRSLEQMRDNRYYQQMQAQADQLRTVYSNFDLGQEMQNPAFARMVLPGWKGGLGMSMEDAFHAVHHKEIAAAREKAVQDEVSKRIAADIAANGRRPDEMGARQAPSVVTFDYRNATKEQREALKAEIRSAKAQGRKVYPGSFGG